MYGSTEPFLHPKRRKVLAVSHVEILGEELEGRVGGGGSGAKVTTATGCTVCRRVGQP